MNKQTRCHLRAIARLHPEIGNLCDQLEAPWNAVRRIAHAPGAAAQWERAEQVLGELVEKRRATAPRRSRLEAARLEALKRMGPPMEGEENLQAACEPRGRRRSAGRPRSQAHVRAIGMLVCGAALPGGKRASRAHEAASRWTFAAYLSRACLSRPLADPIQRTQHGWRYGMTRAALARVSAPLALRQAGQRHARDRQEQSRRRPPADGASPKVIDPPATATATATLAIPLDGLTITAPQPEMLSQKNVESVTGIPARVFLDTIRAPGFPLPVTKLGKLRLVQREAFVAYLRALAGEPASRRDAEADERTRVAAVLASAGLEPVRMSAHRPGERSSRRRKPW